MLSERRVALTDAIVLTLLSALGLALFCVLVPSIGVVLVTVGIPLVALCLPLLRRLADYHRRWAGRLLGTEIVEPYLPIAPANMVIRLARQARDPASWRDLAWLLYNSTVGLAIYLVAVVYGLLALFLWWLPPACFLSHQRQSRPQPALARPPVVSERTGRGAGRVPGRGGRCLGGRDPADRTGPARRGPGQAGRARHQPRAGRTVGRRAIRSRPGSCWPMPGQTSGAALTELRSLVRGIHPPVLADRGLVGAVQALALAAPIPVVVEARVDGRLPAPAESAGYFAVAEVLTNVIKHARAERAVILLAQQDDRAAHPGPRRRGRRCPARARGRIARHRTTTGRLRRDDAGGQPGRRSDHRHDGVALPGSRASPGGLTGVDGPGALASRTVGLIACS